MVTRVEIEHGLKKNNSGTKTLLIRYNLPRTVEFLHCLLGAHCSKPLNHDVTFSVSHLHHRGTSCQLPENGRFVLIEGRRFSLV